MFEAPPDTVALGFAIALGAGVLIGMEREHDARDKQTGTFGGVRTFPLISLGGALGAYMFPVLGAAAFVGPLVVLGILLGIHAWWERERNDEFLPGLTTEIAALVTFCIGAVPLLPIRGMDVSGRAILTAALAGAVMTLLAVRRPLHKLAEKIKREEMYATVRFVVIAAIILPFLPNQTYGPYDAFNPFWIGVFVVLIVGISFASYVAYRALGGRRGSMLTAMLGGLVSSTATTLSFSRHAKSNNGNAPTVLFAIAIALASVVMVPRLAIEAGVADYNSLQTFAIPLTATFVGFLAGVGLMLWRAKGALKQNIDLELDNPFRLTKALQFAAVFTAIRFLTAAAQAELGNGGVYASAALAGLVELNAITLSLADIGGNGLGREEAAFALSLAIGTNAISKGVIAALIGGRKLGLLVTAILLPGALAGIAAALIQAHV